jgi:hypothetical protein
MTVLAQRLANLFLQRKTGVIRSNCDSHGFPP